MAAATPFTMAWVMFNGESLLPDTVNWFIILPMVIIGAIEYMLLIVSIRLADVSVVMPYRYSRIIFLLVQGIFVFDKKPEALMLLGVALIIGSGT